MTLPFVRWTCLVALALSAAITGHAQAPASSAAAADPRVGLTPGFRNAGEAVRNMQLVATLPKPDGFFDPKAPAGPPLPPEQPEKPGAAPETAADTETTSERQDGQPTQAARRQASTRKSRSPTQISRSAGI